MQRVQNCLARVVLRATRFSPSLPLLKQLHWLPVNYRITFKLSTLTYRALAIHQPPSLASLLHFSNIPRQLRSSTSQQLSIPRTKLNLGKRAFSVTAPIIWNELPTTLKSCESLASFRKHLKTYLLKNCFSTLNSRRPLKTDDDPCMSPALEYDYWFCFVVLLSSDLRGFKRHRSYIIIIIIIIIIVGRIIFSLCPILDESTDVYRIWCQSVHPFGSFPNLVPIGRAV